MIERIEIAFKGEFGTSSGVVVTLLQRETVHERDDFCLQSEGTP